MKRTRRIEVIRYSRRVTKFTNGGALEADTTAERAAIDVLLQMPEAIPITAAEIVDTNRQGAKSDTLYTVRNGRFPKLFGWLETKLSWRNTTGKQG
ncbi:MAG TPA: hypothetical protein VE135_28215 [Pyrinomonadaceae bacterium]|nr:hypothetical protein [Pyrinomonadaceae bacterium]